MAAKVHLDFDIYKMVSDSDIKKLMAEEKKAKNRKMAEEKKSKNRKYNTVVNLLTNQEIELSKKSKFVSYADKVNERFYTSSSNMLI